MTTGEAPIDWVADREAGDSADSGEERRYDRTLGFGAADIGSATWLPDDLDGLSGVVDKTGEPFNGAFVPLVVHDPAMSERSFDAAEWAADLIRLAGGLCLCITPFAERGTTAGAPLTHRQWNHTAAMVERLDELCNRYRLRAVVSDTIGQRQARSEGGIDPALPIHYVLDAGSFLPDGFIPTRLVSPERAGPGDLPLFD